MNRIRSAGETATRDAEDSGKNKERLAVQNSEMRQLLVSLSAAVERSEKEADNCRTRLENLGVSTLPPAKSGIR